MASSDDEFDALPQSVSNYHFVDEKDEPISFSVLPLQWAEEESPDGETKEVFLHGIFDDGLRKIFRQVMAWKFNLSETVPEISVLSMENNWIKLQKPRKSFEDEIRSILITVHCLHLVKQNPEISGKSLWDQLARIFSLYDIRPSQNDLVDHMSLISEAVKRDETLGKSKFLLSFLEEKPQKRKEFDEVVQTAAKPGFIVDDDDDDMIDVAEENESDEEEDLFDSVCAICDNGGDLLCCDGRCMRSFHATKVAGAGLCASLGLTEDQVEAMQSFFCENCQYEQHQCFCCGKLGSSNKSSAEVFRCVNATCGRFYHPHCVAKLLHREDEVAAEELQKKIAAGETFTCPIHKCYVCNKGEIKKEPDLQFAVCRRCPKSYHRKCLPRKIAFEDMEDEGIIQRAWEGLLPNRILIYCLKHEIDDDIGTPIRDHIKFPIVQEKGKKQASELLSSKGKVGLKKRPLASEGSAQEKTATKASKQVEKSSLAMKEVDSINRSVKRSSEPDSLKKLKANDASMKSMHDTKPVPKRVEKSATANENGTSLGDKLFDFYCKGSGQVKSRRQATPNGASDKTVTAKPTKESLSSLPVQLDADTERRILALIKESTSSITLEEIIQKHKVPSTHAYSSRNNIDKTITHGKVEGSVEALKAALQKLEKGCSIEDAKAVCEPEVLNQMVRWKNKLKVYLAPFLHGMRYTSFGRHFTKVDKLKEIVDKLHWYVQNGDMIVDFCCGANDFSCLMRSKLEETGKKCSYKNYDVLQPRTKRFEQLNSASHIIKQALEHDFNFEKRDWMTVQPKELPTGSQLIMGLNPPFGVKAALANQFVNKALDFKPKLLILIVPPETERLETKKSPYDLVWEDNEKLSGKSFYLPGSVDANDKQMEQWNVTPPVLSLWSRPDWTAKHKAIAEKHGHLFRVVEQSHLDGNHDEIPVSCRPMEDSCSHHGDTSMLMDGNPVQKDGPKLEESRAIATGGCKESSPCINGREGHVNHDPKEDQYNESSKRRRRGKGNHGRVEADISPKDKLNGGRPPVSEMYNARPRRSSPSMTNVTDVRTSLEDRPMEVDEEGYRHFHPSVSGPGFQFGRGYGGTGAGIPDDPARWYNLNDREPYSSGTHRWSSGYAPDSFGYRTYASENVRESDIRSQVRLYGQHDPDSFTQRGSYTVNQDPGFSQLSSLSSSYGHLGSTMERYAPRLDELNHTRMSTLGPEPPVGSRNGSVYDPLGPRPRSRFDSMGFATGPRNPFSHQGSSGWLNE